MEYQLALSNNLTCSYQLRHSSRAKYLRIKISPIGEVSVVVPHRASEQQAHRFIEEKKTWIKKCLQEIADKPQLDIALPNNLVLAFTGEDWPIDYKTTDNSKTTLTQTSSNHLLITGHNPNPSIVFKLLGMWLKDRAKNVFPHLLDSLSRECGLPYNRITIRGQKTRWGSCSSQKNISLNYKLLFFPKAVVRYVFIHELCHTLEMNHSPRFWNLVEQFVPDYQQHRLTLKAVSDFIPRGLE